MSPLILGLNLKVPPLGRWGWLAVVVLAVIASVVGTSVSGMITIGKQTGDSGQFAEFGWDVKYEVSRLEGIRVFDVSYRGTKALSDVRLPYIYVRYDERDYPLGSLYDKLGTENSTYRDDLQKVGIPDGVELRATFEFYQFPRRGSYLYIQRYRFHENGRMDALVEIFGPGYGPSAHYDTVWMIRPSHGPLPQSSFEEQRDGWRPVDREGRLAYEDYNVPEGMRQAVWRFGQGGRMVAIEPAPQDRAVVYVGVWDPTEAPGEGSTTPPSELIGDAPLHSSPLVIYYVSHQYASQDGCDPDRPCTTGPTLIVESKR